MPMDPVSSADHIVLILRQKLAERARATAKDKGRVRQGHDAEVAQTPVVQQLASIEGVDEHQLRRALVQNLLTEQFGSSLLNDAQFQQVVSRVTDAIEDDAEASKLIMQALSELRVL
jgi:hypothetical protein